MLILALLYCHEYVFFIDVRVRCSCSKSNLITVLVLFFELVIFAGLSYLIYLTLIRNSSNWGTEILTVIIFLFVAGISGITIGYLSYHNDVWKISTGMIIVMAIVTTLLFLVFDSKLWIAILKIVLYTIGFGVINYLVANYSKKHNLANNEFDLVVVEQHQNDSLN